MNDTTIRHLVSILATLICALSYFSGYFSGAHGWWWTAIGLIIVYSWVYSTLNK